MLRPFYYSKEIILAFWFSFTATVLFWLISGRAFVLPEMIRFGAVAAVVFIAVRLLVRLVFFIRRISNDRRMRKIMFEHGVTPELLSIMKRRVDSSKTPEQKAENQLILASYLSEGCCYERAFEVLAEIDPRRLSFPSREEHFNIYVYTNLMAGDIKAAREIYNASRYFFDYARMRSSAMPVLHTMGALEYAEGNYIKAENFFTQALAYAVGKAAKCDCEMFLALCYMKTGRLNYAVNAAKTAAGDAQTVYQRRSIEGLRAQLEEQSLQERNNSV